MAEGEREKAQDLTESVKCVSENLKIKLYKTRTFWREIRQFGYMHRKFDRVSPLSSDAQFFRQMARAVAFTETWGLRSSKGKFIHKKRELREGRVGTREQWVHGTKFQDLLKPYFF